MELQRQQDGILTEIGTETCEEEGNEDDFLAAHEKCTDYYHEFRNRDCSAFKFGHEVCSDWKLKEMFRITKELVNWLIIGLIVLQSDVWEISSSTGGGICTCTEAKLLTKLSEIKSGPYSVINYGETMTPLPISSLMYNGKNKSEQFFQIQCHP